MSDSALASRGYIHIDGDSSGTARSRGGRGREERGFRLRGGTAPAGEMVEGS